MSVETTGWLSPDGIFYSGVTIKDGKNDKEYTIVNGSDEFQGDIKKQLEYNEKLKSDLENYLIKL